MKPLTTLIALLLCTGVMAQVKDVGLSKPTSYNPSAYKIIVGSPEVAYKDSTGWHIIDSGKTAMALTRITEMQMRTYSDYNSRINELATNYSHYYQDYKRLRDSVDNANSNSFKNFMDVNSPHYEPLKLVSKVGSDFYAVRFVKPIKKRKKHIVHCDCTYYHIKK